jgi:hypothetical protein
MMDRSVTIQASDIRDLSADELEAVSGGAEPVSFRVGQLGINVGSDGASVHFEGGGVWVIGKDGKIEPF